MKIIKNKKTFQKLIIVLVILILFNFTFPIRVNAYGGGSLITPIRELVLGIGDGLINIAQSIMLPGSPTAVDISSIVTLRWRLNYGDSVGTTIAEGATWLLNNTWIIGEGLAYAADGVSTLLGLTDEFGQLHDDYEEVVMPMIVYSPATIFANLIPALDVNFIHPDVWYRGGEGTWIPVFDPSTNRYTVAYQYNPNNVPANEAEQFADNTAYQLRDTIATWYKALRNVAIVGLLTVLVYVAIRIIMSSSAGDTAKYKTMLKDWFIAMCILFFMHYMMAFLLKATEMVTDLFATDIILTNLNDETITAEEIGDRFMNEVRANAEDLATQESDAQKDLKKFGYAIIYMVLIFYTLIFTWRYLKRFIYLAFLTMISPMVALTYPIDKMKDGHAQAFDYWFKEYVFNVLIQPVHLLIYTMLVTSAQSFAETNLIYTIVAIGFLLEAEKIIKAMFGFNKAEGGISSASAAITGGALFGFAANRLKQAAGYLPGGDKKEGKGSSNGDSRKIDFNDREADTGIPKFQSWRRLKRRFWRRLRRRLWR